MKWQCIIAWLIAGLFLGSFITHLYFEVRKKLEVGDSILAVSITCGIVIGTLSLLVVMVLLFMQGNCF
jgi:hypothetical protein